MKSKMEIVLSYLWRKLAGLEGYLRDLEVRLCRPREVVKLLKEGMSYNSIIEQKICYRRWSKKKSQMDKKWQYQTVKWNYWRRREVSNWRCSSQHLWKLSQHLWKLSQSALGEEGGYNAENLEKRGYQNDDLVCVIIDLLQKREGLVAAHQWKREFQQRKQLIWLLLVITVVHKILVSILLWFFFISASSNEWVLSLS